MEKMDMSDVFKKYLTTLHKANNHIKTVQNRKENLITERKLKRDTLTNARRHIDANMSPYQTPVASQQSKIKPKRESDKKSNAEGVSRRLELLAKWKEERAKRKQLEKAKQRPVFKVCHVSSTPHVNVENVKIPSSVKKSQFAPHNHKFKPPEGIKPLSFSYSNLKSKALENPWKITKSPKRIATSKSELNKQKTPQLLENRVSKNKANHIQRQPTKEVQNQKKTIMKTVPAKPPVALVSTSRQTPVASTSQKKADANKIVKKNVNQSKKIIKTASAESSVSSISKNRQTPIARSSRQTVDKNKIAKVKTQTPITSTNQKNVDTNKPSKSNIKDVKKTVTSSSKKKTPRNIKTEDKDVKLKDEATNNEIEELPNKGIEETPQNNKINEVAKSPVSTPVYVSPFVTISRGKRSAREEFKIRNSHGKEVLKQISPEKVEFFNSYTSPRAGADYFMVKLNSEIDRINKMCQEWENYLEEPQLPEEARSSIDVTIGQSKLLISKKFKQFRGLIVQCRTKQYEEKEITCEDLHGFWDMVYMQVEDLDRRFANLEKLKQNNWEELLPEKKAPVKKTRARTKKAVGGTSRLKDIIRAAREKKKDTVAESDKNGGCFEVQTPVKEEPSKSNADNSRKSTRVSLLVTEKRPSSSPGLILMKISQSIKQGNGLTPAKSILKNERSKSTGKKSVVFKENLGPMRLRRTVLFSETKKEIVRGSGDLSEEKENTPIGLRRSSRLMRMSCVE